jgi:uncharacterized protein YkwD
VKATVLALVTLAACGGDDPGTTKGGSSSSSSSSGGPSGGDPVLDDARAYTLQKINGYRKQAGAQPLALDDALDAFAQAASTALSMSHQPHQYFVDHAPTCGCNVTAENQGDPNGIPPANVHTQIDEILSLMMSGGPGEGHHDNIVDPNSKRLGVGVVDPGQRMYFTNDFGP